MRAVKAIQQQEAAARRESNSLIVTIESIHKWMNVRLTKVCEKINFVTPYLFNSLHYLNTTKRFLFFLPFHFYFYFIVIIFFLKKCWPPLLMSVRLPQIVLKMIFWWIFWVSLSSVCIAFNFNRQLCCLFIVLWTKYSSIHLICCQKKRQ